MTQTSFPKITLYGDTKSTCTQRVVILFEELNLNYQVVPVNLQEGEHKNEEFLKMQPFGKIPVVRYKETEESDEKVLFESRTILRYFSNKFDEEVDLYPDVYADMYCEANSQNLTPLVSKIVYELCFRKREEGEEVNQRLVDETMEQLKSVLEVYNNRLKHSKFMAGSTFTIADIEAIPYLLYFVKQNKEFLKQYKHVYHWFKKVKARNSVRRALEQA